MHNPESARENEIHKVLWDFEIQTDHLITARKSVLVISCQQQQQQKEESLHLLNLVAYALYVIKLPSYKLPTQFMQHFYREHLSPVYFRYQMHFLLFLFPVSDFHNCIYCCQKGFQVNIQQYQITFNIFSKFSARILELKDYRCDRALDSRFNFKHSSSECNIKLYLVLRLQSLSFGESGVPNHCYYSQVHFDPGSCICQGSIYWLNYIIIPC